MLHSSFRLAAVLSCILLSSCAAIKEKTIIEPENWPAQKQLRQQIEIWEIRGRLGVQTETTGGSVDLIWKQSREDYSIRLIMPLGVGTYLIQGNGKRALIRYPNGRKRMVSNIDQVFSSVLGVSLPVSAIKDWVRGLPAKSLTVENRQWDEQDLLSQIKQSGWSVEMTNYIGYELLLPHAIYLSRDDNPELDIRLVLKQWLADN